MAVSNGGTILLAEDEDVVRRLLRTVLENAGYVVLEAASGEEAAEIAKRHAGRIDLVVTDLVMPGIDGRETAATILRERPELEVMYMSGSVDEPGRSGLEPGERFLQKPFPSDVLVERVGKILDPAAQPKTAGRARQSWVTERPD
jgi:two-component system, cell cycle sensor histidine kinase and response regulator CckA